VHRRLKRPPHVEHVAGPPGPEAVRPPHGLGRRQRGDEAPDAAKLGRRHVGEVLAAEDLVARRRDEHRRRLVLGGAVVLLGRRRRRHPLGRLRRRLKAEVDRLVRRRARRSLPERGERHVERVDVVAARHERAAQRVVDLLTARQVDLVEAAQRVLEPARPDLEARLAEDAPERDELSDDRIAGGGGGHG
jgi:hypothetical protein